MRRLVETSFPLATVNDISSTEKKRTQGTITNLAILLAMVLPDPTDERWDEVQELYERFSQNHGLLSPTPCNPFLVKTFSTHRLTWLNGAPPISPKATKHHPREILGEAELVVFVGVRFAGGGTEAALGHDGPRHGHQPTSVGHQHVPTWIQSG